MTNTAHSFRRSWRTWVVAGLGACLVMALPSAGISQDTESSRATINWDIKVKVNGEVMKPGDVFKDCDDCPEMVVIPPGSFMMGMDDVSETLDDLYLHESIHITNSSPRHREIVKTPFAAGRFEVTRAQYRKFLEETGYRKDQKFTDLPRYDCMYIGPVRRISRPEMGVIAERGRSMKSPLNHARHVDQDNNPIDCVTVTDAIEYTKWLSHKAGKSYRLLNEIEWEYAARGGNSIPRKWDRKHQSAEICRYANVNDRAFRKAFGAKNAGKEFDAFYFDCNDGYQYSSPVGSFPSNSFGLFDMIGNVREYVMIETLPNRGGVLLRVDGIAAKPASIQKNYYQMLRGGGWSGVGTIEVHPGTRVLVLGLYHNGCDSCGIRVARDVEGAIGSE